MNIDLVITELNVGGAERAMTQLALGLTRRGDDVRVFSLGKLPTETQQTEGEDALVRLLREGGIDVSSGDASTSFEFLRVYGKLKQWLGQRSDALCQSFLVHANIAAMLAASRENSAASVAGIRVAECKSARIFLERYALRRADHVVCVSKGVEKFARENLRLPFNQTSVIPNAVDTVRFANVSAIDWTKLGWELDTPVALFVGRFHPQKGLDLVQQSLNEFLPEGSPTKLVLIGDGPDRTYLEQWASSVPGDRVRVLPWQADVAPWIAACRVVVLPSRYEGMPNVVLEAMASGKPVVCSRVEGSAELIGQDDRQGFESGDSRAMAARIHHFLTDQQDAETTGRCNLDRVNKDFTIDTMVKSYRNLYQRLLS